MAEKKVIELEIKTESLGSLKSQLRQAQADVASLSEKFGATSQEAINAAKRAAELKDAIGDAKALTDAFNPDAKFNALSQSLGGVLNGFQAFEGALGLVGVESESVEKSLLAVNSAMALSQGVSGVLESIDSFKTLGAQIKNLTIVQKLSEGAQKLWNLAMSANPIGLLVVGITALIAAGYKLISWFQESAAESENTAKSIDKHSKELNKQQRELEKSSQRLSDYNKYQYDLAKATGKSSEELRKIALRHAEEELALARKNKEVAKSTYLRELDILATLRANDADEENIKKQEEVVKKARENAQKLRETAAQERKELVDLKRQQRIEIAQEQTDADREAQEKAKEAAQKQLEIQRENAEKQKKLRQQQEEERLKDLERAKEFEVTEEVEAGLFQMLVDSEAEKDAFREEQKAKQEEDELALMQFRGDIYKQDVENALAAEEQKKAAREKNQQLAIGAAKDTLTTISNLAELFAGGSEKQQKKAFEIQKAASIAQASIDTFKSAQAAYASLAGIPVVGPALGAAAAAAAITAGLVNVKKIASQKFEGGGSSASASSGGGAGAMAGAGVEAPTGGGAITPSFNIVGNAQATNPLAGLGNQPLQAYVVSTEVTTAQSLDRNRINYATFG